ncbi:MAG: alpha/beta hydrolase [Candidatus Hydrogenedentota bacterium]|nr:MAG: alpha/beta hydrolase [Candidatus Hydrogenedentota bacterium]
MASWESNIARQTTKLISDLFFANPMPIQYKKYFLEIPSLLLPNIPNVQVASEKIGGVPVERLTPQKKENGILLYFHGGGFMFGSPRTHRRMVSRLAKYLHREAINVDYRLAPKHPFPAPIEDAYLVYTALLNQGISPADILLGGDSAGGGLCISLLQELREKNIELPSGAVLFSPWGDMHGNSVSHVARDELDPMLQGSKIGGWAKDYLQGASPDNPKASVIFADYTGFPPLLIQVGSDEVLFDDAIRIEKKAREANVPVQLTVYDKMFHVWQIWAPWVPESEKALQEVVSWQKSMELGRT